MIGPFLNALGILLGSLFGILRREPLPVRTQMFFKSALGAFTALCGLHLLWLNTGGTIVTVLKQLFIAVIALLLGNLLGKLLALQKMSNRAGRYAAGLLSGAKGPDGKTRASDGFLAASILFCAAPLGMVGAVTEGLDGYFYPLAIKAVMDGLAMTSFVKIFRWPVALAAAPVFFLFNGLAVTVHAFVLPMLDTPLLLQSVGAAAGLVICAMTLVILEVRRVELANYLPALFIAPLLTWVLL